MKKIICVLLALVLLTLCGCAGNKEDKLSPVMQEYLEEIDEIESPVREYGEEKSQTLFGEKLVVNALYPETGIRELDSETELWINNLISAYQLEVAENKPEYTAELLLSYESFLYDDKYVSVKLSGELITSYLAHPVEIIKTFNGSIETGELLSLDELISSEEKTVLTEKLTEKANIEKEFLDDKVFDNWLLTKEGLVVVLPQGEYLPMSEGTKKVLFSFSDLQGMFSADTKEEFGEEENKEVSAIPSIPEKQTVDPTKPMVALTFDDGPGAHTERLLEIFRTYGGKGSFFVVGNMIGNRPDTIKRIVADGHEIGGHSFNHRQFTNLSKEEISDQIMKTRAQIYNLTGVDSRIVRPPYGAVNDTVRGVGKELDVSYVNWSVDTLDWKNKDATKIYNHIMESTSDGDIILCHDLHKTTVDAMEKVIPALIQKGYQLVTVSELLESKENYPEAGKVYYRG